MTETESRSSENDHDKKKKLNFNVRQMMQTIQEQKAKNLKVLAFKLLMGLIASLQVFIGHFYCACCIIGSASMLHMEVISLGHVLRKDNKINVFHWLDLYWYVIGAYICLPIVFLRRSLIENDVYFQSDLLTLFLYQYHSLISQVSIMVGLMLTVVKLNRGYVKYQLKRTLWTISSLGYVFMLSTVQIYNLYQGYIWVVVPISCVRFNGWVTKQIHLNRSKKKAPIHKYLPKKDKTSIIVACILTGLFAYIITGYLCQFKHMVCQQKEIHTRKFEAKQCEVDEIFNITQVKFNSVWPYLHKFDGPTEIRGEGMKQPIEAPVDGNIFTIRMA